MVVVVALAHHAGGGRSNRPATSLITERETRSRWLFIPAFAAERDDRYNRKKEATNPPVATFDLRSEENDHRDEVRQRTCHLIRE
jgi:hypothetical protein